MGVVALKFLAKLEDIVKRSKRALPINAIKLALVLDVYLEVVFTSKLSCFVLGTP